MSFLDAGVKDQISRLTAVGSADSVFSQLSAFTRLVASSSVLGRALTEADSSMGARRALVADLTRGQLSDETLDVIAAVASSPRITSKSLAQALAEASAEVGFGAAGATGELVVVESGLYDVATAIRTNADLREVVTNPGISDKAKEDFLVDLLGAKVNSRVVEFIKTILALGHGRDVDASAQDLSEQAAALRHKVIAEVQTAVELDETRKAHLVAALEQSVGKSIQGRFSVDPTIVGSVVVRIGDEVFDGSIRHRLEQAKVALTSAR